jgi:hypothetical protein
MTTEAFAKSLRLFVELAQSGRIVHQRRLSQNLKGGDLRADLPVDVSCQVVSYTSRSLVPIGLKCPDVIDGKIYSQ